MENNLLQIEYTQTKDNVCIAMGRYKRPGSVPIILAHGLAQNSYFWDFPVANHSFAKYLYNKGYDVWLPCLRGHGNGHIHSDAKTDWSWNIDDLAIYDVSAIISKVHESTSQKPFWVGHSLGGTLPYMYLQGVYYTHKKVGKELSNNEYHDIYKKTIAVSKNKAKRRNDLLQGLVTVASPVTMTWSNDTYLGKIMYHQIWQEMHVFSFLSNSKLMRSYLNKVPYLPISTIFSFFDKNIWGKWLQKCIHWPISHIGTTRAFSLFWYPPNMNRQLIETLMRVSLNDICTEVLEQFADWIQHKTFRSFPKGSEVPHIYSEHFSSIQCPLLLIAGNEDKICKPAILYSDGFNKMGTDNKQYKCFDKFGHNDLCMGLSAPAEVFPFIENWIKNIQTKL